MNTNSEQEMTVAELRSFGLSTGAIFAVLFGLLIPWIWDLQYPRWPWVVFIVLGGLGLVAPKSLRVVHRVWMRFALLISKVTTPIIMGIVFFLVIMPIGLAMRIFARDPMEQKFDASAQSYRVTTDRQFTGSLEKPY